MLFLRGALVPLLSFIHLLMQRLLHTLLYIIGVSLAALTGTANGFAQTGQPGQTVSDTAEVTKVSLITCSPGPLIYELYGHTALRVREGRPGLQSDWVFNYGTFSFRQPHFIWRFMLGKTDYQLSVEPYNYFYEAYAREGRAIYEQRLNLTQAEARRLVDALSYNVQPDHASYRYNFFYDNCVTRAIRMIEQSVDGKVVWPKLPADSVKTLRDLINEYSASTPWDALGQNLLVGAEADRPASLSDQMFAPLYAQRFVAEASIKGNDGSVRQLAQPAITLLPAQPLQQADGVPGPLWVFGIVLALTLILTVWEWRRKRYWWGVDVVLLIAQGLAGCIVAFLFFFSEHPAVGSNWLVILFNPLPLLFFPWWMKQAANRRVCRAAYLEALMLLATIVVGVCGIQSLPSDIYLMVDALALRTVAHLVFCRRPGAKEVA